MELTILGASAATQNPGGACASYLIQQDDTAIVVDMGSGAFARLQQHSAPDAIDAIVISHTHADHILDLIPYRYWLAFNAQPGVPARRPRLVLPPAGHDTLLQLSGTQDPSPTFFADTFDVASYDPAQSLSVGPLTITFHAVRHAPHTYGLRIQGNGLLAYSADSGPCPDLVDVARGADLFLCENANPEGSDFALHLTPRQAGSYAQEAGARRLLLTHRWHVNGLDTSVRQAAEAYDGPVSVAREGDVYRVGH